MTLLSRTEIEGALSRLGELAQARGKSVELLMISLIEQLANAALARDALKVRRLAQDLVRSSPLSSLERPTIASPEALIVAAALVELLAFRNHVPSPSWTAIVGGMESPFHLLNAAERMPRLRAWCEAESPEPLRRRKLFAPPDYLSEV